MFTRAACSSPLVYCNTGLINLRIYQNLKYLCFILHFISHYFVSHFYCLDFDEEWNNRAGRLSALLHCESYCVLLYAHDSC